MNLEQIYQPIENDLAQVECFLRECVRESENQSIRQMSDLLLESGGKKLRPALVILSERAASAGRNTPCSHYELIKLAAAMELIHIASLIHDDVLDGAVMRHNKPSINTKLGSNISIIFGDYIYSKALKLVSQCRSFEVFECICYTINGMCEGELIQVCQRGNVGLSKDNYITIARRKTAAFFSACCHVGAIIGGHSRAVQAMLKEFGMNFGIAFQIIDDCRDVLCKESVLGKHPGQDMAVGDMTLPLLNLLETVDSNKRSEIIEILESPIGNDGLEKIRKMLHSTNALDCTRETALYYIECAKYELNELEDSVYKRSLNRLTNSIGQEAKLILRGESWKNQRF